MSPAFCHQVVDLLDRSSVQGVFVDEEPSGAVIRLPDPASTLQLTVGVGEDGTWGWERSAFSETQGRGDLELPPEPSAEDVADAVLVELLGMKPTCGWCDKRVSECRCD